MSEIKEASDFQKVIKTLGELYLLPHQDIQRYVMNVPSTEDQETFEAYFRYIQLLLLGKSEQDFEALCALVSEISQYMVMFGLVADAYEVIGRLKWLAWQGDYDWDDVLAEYQPVVKAALRVSDIEALDNEFAWQMFSSLELD